MSQYLENLSIGSTVDVRGPNGLIEYVGVGMFTSQVDKKSAPFSKQTKEVSYIIYSLLLKIYFDKSLVRTATNWQCSRIEKGSPCVVCHWKYSISSNLCVSISVLSGNFIYNLFEDGKGQYQFLNIQFMD